MQKEEEEKAKAKKLKESMSSDNVTLHADGIEGMAAAPIDTSAPEAKN